MAVLLIAHRAPSSARAAAERVAAGARMFEIDVQVRAGRLVSSHYLPLHRAWARVPVERDNWRFRRSPGTDVALDEVIDRIPTTCDILLDPKHHPSMSASDLAAAIGRAVAASTRPGRFVVSTGDPGLLRSYRDVGLRTWRSIGARASLDLALAEGPLPEQGVSIRHTLLDAETVTALHAVSGIIVAWTVNSVDRARRLSDFGVDAITTDRASVLGAVRECTE